MNIADTAQADIDRRAAFEPCKLFLNGDEPVLSLRGYHVHKMNQRYVVVAYVKWLAQYLCFYFNPGECDMAWPISWVEP